MGLSANVVTRLLEGWKSEYESWNRRDLSGKEYVYIWADGIHTNVRLEDPETKRQCMLVLMGATPEGKKELIAVVDWLSRERTKLARVAGRPEAARTLSRSEDRRG